MGRPRVVAPEVDPAWLIYGSRARYAVEIAEIIWRLGAEVAALVDNLAGGPQPSPLGEPTTPALLTEEQKALATVIPQLTPGYRFAMEREARSIGIGNFPSLIDPTAILARRLQIGEGTVLNAGVVIGASTTIGRFVQINRSTSVGHDVRIGPFVSIGPGTVVSSETMIERGAFIGSGAVFRPGVAVGANAIVGSGSVVIRDVAPHTVVAGNPARVLRDGIPGHHDVGVD